MSNRDTQFAGFAGLLAKEIDDAIANMEDQAIYSEKFTERLNAIIARRAYDFACHTVSYLDNDVGWRMGKGYTAAQIVENDVPDMTAWPEEEK